MITPRIFTGICLCLTVLAAAPSIPAGAASAALKGKQLRLPDSAFAPASVVPQYDYAEKPKDANSDWFRGNHQTGYKKLGMITGYYERADGRSSAGKLIFHYQGTVYGSASEAAKAFQDGIAGSGRFTDRKSLCLPGLSVPCWTFTYPATGAVTGKNTERDTETYSIMQVHECVAEFAATARKRVFTASSATITQTRTTMIQAAANLLQQLCTG